MRDRRQAVEANGDIEAGVCSNAGVCLTRSSPCSVDLGPAEQEEGGSLGAEKS